MTEDEAIALFEAAAAKQAQCDYPGCIADYKTFLTYCRQVEDKEGECRAYCNIGNAYDSLGDYQLALDYHKKDLAIAQELGDKGGPCCPCK